jgi:hypothetical protein
MTELKKKKRKNAMVKEKESKNEREKKSVESDFWQFFTNLGDFYKISQVFIVLR